MSVTSIIDDIRVGMAIATDLFDLGQSVLEMVARGDAKSVREIFPSELQTTLARRAAEARAKKKNDTEAAAR